jgi:hypothetical protein
MCHVSEYCNRKMWNGVTSVLWCQSVVGWCLPLPPAAPQETNGRWPPELQHHHHQQMLLLHQC